MKQSKLTQEQLQHRCAEVFLMNDGDEVYDLTVDETGKVKISMGEVGTKEEGFRWVYFDYEPDMSERPQALAYLLGERNDFND